MNYFIKFSLIGLYHNQKKNLCLQICQKYLTIYIFILSLMLQPIYKVEGQTDTSNGHFYDHLQNQLYFIKEGQLCKKDLSSQSKSDVVPIKIYSYCDKRNQFSKLLKVKSQKDQVSPKSNQCKFNLQKTLVTNQSNSENKFRSSEQITSGSVWSWNVPNLNKVFLGVIQITKSNNLFQTYINLTASSSRTVTCNWQNGQLRTWVNGQVPAKSHITQINIQPSRQSKFYALVSFKGKGQTIVYNPFARIPNENFNFQFAKNSQSAQLAVQSYPDQKLAKITQLNKNKLLLVAQNGYIKAVHRNIQTNRFDFSSIQVSNEGLISGLICQEQWKILSTDNFVKQLWASVKGSSSFKVPEIKQLIQHSIKIIQKHNAQNQTQAYRILLSKALVLRSVHHEFNIVNPIYESELDRQQYNQTSNSIYFDLPKNVSNNIPKAVILNQESWTKIDGKIQEITENYILSIDEQTVIIYHIGDRVKEVFRENIIFFQFSKHSFLERYNENDLRILKKGESSSSIYKLLVNCISKEKKVPTQIFKINEKDMKELTHDYKISQADAKLSLEQAGNVQEALVWLSRAQNERVYIQKHEESKSKGTQQQAIKGSIVQLANIPLAKLLLKVNNHIYLLGYDPQNLKKVLFKGEKQFINLFDLKRQSNLKQIDQQSWFSSQNHQALTILDSLTTKYKNGFVFQESQQVFLLGVEEQNLTKTPILINEKCIFENQNSLSLSDNEIIEGQTNINKVTKGISGQIFYDFKVNRNKSVEQKDTIIVNGSLHSNWNLNTERILEIQATVNQQTFEVSYQSLKSQDPQILPLLIESGPPSCNNHYSISEILTPGSSFLANYPRPIKFKNLHSKNMRLTSFFIQRGSKKYTVNSIIQGNLYFESESGIRSKRYPFKFQQNQQNKQITIQNKGFWKYIILQPIFTKEKKMPFEIGFVKAKGYTLQKQVYEQILIKNLQNFVEIHSNQKAVQYQVQNVTQTSNKVLKLSLKLDDEYKSINNYYLGQCRKIFKKILNNTSKLIQRPQLTNEQEEQQKSLKNIEKLSPKDFLNLFLKTNLQSSLLKSIVKNDQFSFANWENIEIRKFMDLTFSKAQDLKQQIFKALFDKILLSGFGKKYLSEQASDLGKLYTAYPQNFLLYVMKKIQPLQHRQNLKDILKQIPKYRSQTYKQIRKQKNPYLLLEDNFYSKYYLQQIERQQNHNENVPSQDKNPIFEETQLIPSQFAVIRDQFSRKIYVKLEHFSNVKSIVLRFDKTQSSSKVNFKVFSLESIGRKLLENGIIQQHQWNQIAKNNYQDSVKSLFSETSESLNTFTINIQRSSKTKLLQIEIGYHETGIFVHQYLTKNFPFIDIIPEIYGEQVNANIEENQSNFSQIFNLFSFKEQQSFYLSTIEIGVTSVQKFSISRENQYQYSYFKPTDQKIESLRKNIQQKVQNKDFSSVISDHKKLVNTYKKHSKKPNLDYIFTLLMLTLEQIFLNKIKIEQQICKELFDLIIKEQVGPIRISAFKAASNCINYLIKSLPYVEQEGYLPNLEQTTFDQKEIQSVLDLKNIPLCNSLNKLVVNSIPYKDQWAKFLIKITPVTQKYQDNIRYIVKSNSWFKVPQILIFFSEIPQSYFATILLSNLDGPTLQKYILESKKIQKTARVHLLVDKLIQTYNGKIDLDIVSMMLEEKDIKWHNLFKIIKMCPEAQDLILSQYLQSGLENPIKLAQNYPQILNQAAKSVKHSQNLASFLSKLFSLNRRVFKNAILSLSDQIVSLHSDLYEVLAFYLYEECNFGGVQGSKLLKQQQLIDLHVAQILLKKISLPSSEQNPNNELIQEQVFIEWYFCNNSYEQDHVNPANKSPGSHLIKGLSQKVLQLIQNRPIDKILKVFDRLIKQIQIQSIPLSTKHIYINQINQGVSQLLNKTINPSSLSQILVEGENNDMIKRIFQSLDLLSSKSAKNNSNQSQKGWQNSKQIELIEKFTATTVKQKIKDWQANRNGTKNTLFRVPSNQKRITFKSTEVQGFTLSKILIGFNATDTAQKNNIFPGSVQVFGGQDQNNLVKICDLKQIRDQHFESFGTRSYGINFNSLPFRKCSSSIQTIQFRLSQPLLTSLSDVFQSSQKSKKDSFFNVTFVSLLAYQSQPKVQPAYNQIYTTILSFLGDQKYSSTLKRVIQTPYYKQKSSSILRLLNSLLPNKSIESILLSLNRQNQDVLQSVFQNEHPNIQLIQLLTQVNPSSDNIRKLLRHFVSRRLDKINQIIVAAIKLFSYSYPNKKIDFDVNELIKLYEESGYKRSVFVVLTAVLSTPKSFGFNYSTLLETFWKKDSSLRPIYYEIIGATIAHYDASLNQFLNSGKTQQLIEQTKVLFTTKNSKIQGHIYLISQLCLHHENRQYLIEKDIPIAFVNYLRNEETLLNKQYSASMKYFILFFQSTCIHSACEERFSQILIELMVKLPQVPAAHHNFFIHEFFFPLINAFKGISLKLVWKNLNNRYLHQATHSLKTSPIKPAQNTLIIDNLYLEKASFNNWQNVSERSQYRVLDKNNQIVANDSAVQLSDKPQCEFKLYKIVNEQTRNLLTNQTLINLKNLGIFGPNYQNTVPVQDSTYQNIYYVPCEMTLNDLLKQINICGFRLNEQAIKETKFTDFNSQSQALLSKDTPIQELLLPEKRHLSILQVNPQGLFSHTSIQKIVKNPAGPHVFIPQQTIFKAFERKEGLMKMIKVMKTCVKNWTNSQQSKIWEQYLNELQSYSCFPVFSSIYMNKQDNVQLLFDILSGLPDKEDSAKWIELQKTSVKFLYNIIKDVFEVEGSKALQIRKYAVDNGFYKTMLERLHLVSKQQKRVKVQEIQEQEQQLSIPTNIKKINSQDDYKLKVIKKKGIGYGNDSSSNQKWDIAGQEESKKQVSTQILGLLKILQKFLDHKMFVPPKQIVQQTFESALLPILESSLRGGSLLEISKSADLFKGQLSFIKALTKKRQLTPIFMSIPKIYEPKQHQSILELLKVLESTSRIFLSCLTGSVGEKLSQQIAKEIIQTYEMVEETISNYNLDHVDQDQEKKILQLPLTKKYPILLKDLRFDYVDMKDKNGKISKHHYSANFVVNHTNPPAKTIRLAQELADISHALPVQHTNAIYVRCDKQRVDFMQALIMGSNGTPYGHGAYLFDIYFDDTYPNNPPKVNLTTTGNGQIRFNPNLYSCGKVCLSLLGTWRGSASQNWDPKVSTLLQILVSIQSIIMSEEVYFNEPGFEHEQGTVEGQKKNQAYANIVRYGNIKFAMIQNMKNPPKGFEHIIKRHFYLKKAQILEQTKKWLKYAQKREASYNGLVSDHNNNWSNQFKKSKTEYKTMLQKAIKQLQEELNKLSEPSNKDLKTLSSPKKQKKKQAKFESKDQNIEEVDVTYDKSEQSNLKQLDINDQKVKDRWSRYIGAMGIQAVSKQSKASILLFGLGATGVQIAKNIILSGCKKISIFDQENVSINDLSGQFFIGEEDLGKNRVESCLYKLQQLNHYVRVQNLKEFSHDNLEVLKSYDVVILTQQSLSRQKIINNYCHQNGIKFIITDCYGPYGQVFNDFGNDFEVLDKNGEETVEVMIQSITNAEKGVVTLLNKQRHPYEDGQAVRITGVKGMIKQNGEPINGTIHKIRVINQYSFEIGNTTQYSPYQVDGLARNMKLPIKVQFKSLQQSIKLCNVDGNLSFYDFEKGTKNQLLHQCFLTLSNFKQKNERSPKPWNWEDAEDFIKLLKETYTEQLKAQEINYIRVFAYTCSGTFAPLAAFYGGLTAQQVFKAITGKYMPINQYFFTEFTEVVPSIPETDEQIKTLLSNLNYQQSKQNRNQGLRKIIGNQLIELIQKCRVFLIGSGAIGCQLLKNYAMINLATSKQGGEIIVTDPDHIEESNLNRQFLFREKHLRKPKSVTAAAAVAQMNKLLKGKIRAKLDRVCQTTKDVFSNEFFQSLSIVTNALDNVKARQYVDQRCVENKVALLESGTLSSKGHVQVIIPYVTQTYGSKNDPAEQGQIPHCTLKMFPEQTLHCVEWARDIFGKTFTLDPKALSKLVEKLKQYQPNSADLEMLKNCLKMVQIKPKNFEEAVYIATNKFFQLYRNDIKQLLYTYPLDAKTKDGKPFWKLPKRPPTPIQEIDPENQLHYTFISAYSVLLCKIFNVDHPKDFRKEQRRKQICNEAAKIKIQPFVPNDKLAKQMTEEVDKNQTGQNAQNKEKIQEKTQNQEQQVIVDEITIFDSIKKILQENTSDVKINAEEFEKDDDQNGHIDLIYSMANLRAGNYKLQPMDWMTTKLKAGRITPALSTTTSCVAALQTIELIKYLKKCKLDKMRNTFINLAVPMIQAGEPGEVEKIKIHQSLTTNIWERWQIGPLDLNTATVSDLLSSVEQKYKIKVKILSILEGAQLYSDLVLGLQSKKEQKEQYLRKSLKQVLQSEVSQQDLKKFIDLTLVFGINDELAKHVPTIRLKLSE